MDLKDTTKQPLLNEKPRRSKTTKTIAVKFAHKFLFQTKTSN